MTQTIVVKRRDHQKELLKEVDLKNSGVVNLEITRAMLKGHFDRKSSSGLEPDEKVRRRRRKLRRFNRTPNVILSAT